MRFAVAAMVAAMVTVDGRAYSSYALKKVKETRHKLERIHGRGLVGLYNEHNEFRPHRLSKGLKNNKLGASISIDGIDGTFELDSWIVNFLGALDGFTYSEVQGEENAISNCFFAGYSIVENVTDIGYIFNNAG